MVRTIVVNAQDLFVGSIPSLALTEYCVRAVLQECGYDVESGVPDQTETRDIVLSRIELATLVMKTVMGIPTHAVITLRQPKPGLFHIIFHF